MTTQNELITGLQGAADKARGEEKAEGRKEMEVELEARLKEAFDEGYRRVEDKVVDQVMEAEADVRASQHSQSFKLGYCKCLTTQGSDWKTREGLPSKCYPLLQLNQSRRDQLTKLPLVPHLSRCL